MLAVRRVTVDERRARLARRHGVHPEHRLSTVEDACDAVVALHGTDPAGVYLAAAARVRPDVTAADVDRALYADRSVVKHMAMRRTLFVMSRDRLPVAIAVAGQRVAHGVRRDLLRDIARAGLYPDPAAWLDTACAEVVDLLSDGRERTLDELRAELPALQGAIEQGAGRSWGGRLAVGPRVLTLLCARGELVRASNAGHWRTSRHRWSSMAGWLGEPLDPVPAEDAEVRLAGWWLRAFGPGTEDDLRWWLGSTLAVVRRALAALGAVPVDLDGRIGHLLPDDLEPEPPVAPWAALLPVLDPSVMGWQDRGWFLGEHGAVGGRVLDSVGNAGPTAWWDGQVVGTWYQSAPGTGDKDEPSTVCLDLFADVGADAVAALRREAERVATFCGGVRAVPPYPDPAPTGRPIRVAAPR